MRLTMLTGMLCCLHWIAIAQENSLSLPLNKIRVNSSYGPRVHPIKGTTGFHYGVDLKARAEPVYTVLAGSVVKAGFDESLGTFLIIDHGELQSIYGHLSHVLVREGESVQAGMLIGITGSTGKVTGEHLHFAIRSKGGYIHPLKFLAGLLQADQAQEQ